VAETGRAAPRFVVAVGPKFAELGKAPASLGKPSKLSIVYERDEAIRDLNRARVDAVRAIWRWPGGSWISPRVQKEVCHFRWEWEQRVPELDTPEIRRTVFVLPEWVTKNKEARVVVLKDVAQRIVHELRGQHPTYVFTGKIGRAGDGASAV